MENGLGFGNLLLPDTIAPGNYHLVAITDQLRANGQPYAIYQQPLIIKSIMEQGFSSSLTVDSLIRNGVIEAKITVSLNNPEADERPVVSYRVGNGELAQHILEDNEFVFHIPAAQANEHAVLHTAIQYGGQLQQLTAGLPRQTPKQLRVKFFPEGGHLVNGLPSIIGWEATTADGTPVALTATLYENGTAIDTLETNEVGTGVFHLTPSSDANYRLIVKAGLFLPRDTGFTLPAVAQKGIVLHMDNAVADDTLRFDLLGNIPQQVKVLVHNYREAFASFETTAIPKGKPVGIALKALPKGIATLTVLDSAGNPVTERLFFAHHNRQIKTVIQLDSPIYGKRQPVQANLTLQDANGQPIQGILSAAVVQMNRLGNRNIENIVNYVYLQNELGSLPPDFIGNKIDNKDYLEQLLLIRGWRNYTWQGLMGAAPTGTTGTTVQPLSGQVKRSGKPLRKPVEIIMLSGLVPQVLTTESDGRFTLPMDGLFVAAGEEVNLTVNTKDKRGYTIDIDDPYWAVIENATENLDTTPTGMADNILNSGALKLDGVAGTRILETVTVTAKADNSIYGTKGLPGRNECGDYVDEFGYLNYPPSATNSKLYQPVKGKIYKIRTDLTTDRNKFVVKNVVYEGCLTAKEQTHFQVNGIHYTKEFYGVSATTPEPQYQSTLFWRPGILTDQNGHYSFDFATGDIDGEFQVIIQGVGSNDVFFGSKKLMVE